MIIPPLHGNLEQPSVFVYAAADQNYFDEFGKTLINSILQNTSMGVHIHLFNPRDDQLEFCNKKDRVSVTYEYVPVELFKNMAAHWTGNNTGDDKLRYSRITTAMSKSNDTSIAERMQRTYFACARFIRLAEARLIAPAFAIDVDAVVRRNITVPAESKDFFIHYISGKKARYLAGGMFFTNLNNSEQFLSEYSTVLKSNIEKDYLYWGIDQDVLDNIVPRYNAGQLLMKYIDWDMSQDSYIWTAKGERKNLEIFKQEQFKYKD